MRRDFVVGELWVFLRKCLDAVSGRVGLLVALNWLFFGCLVLGAVLKEFGIVGVFRWPVGADVFSSEAGDVVSLLIGIFFLNLVFSCFLLVTLTGAAFFGLPLFFLCFRAFLWGVLLNDLSTPAFLFALPTLILEGEGYVFGGLAGVNLGLSWLKPTWVYKKELSRFEAVKQAFRDCVHIYFFVALLLLAAAIVEMMTLVFLLT
jgi:hypothetical protein